MRDNAPFMVVDRDSADMRRWLEFGRVEAIHNLPRVTDGRSYEYVLAHYAGGFQDGVESGADTIFTERMQTLLP